MKNNVKELIVGAALIVLGLFFMLTNFDIFDFSFSGAFVSSFIFFVGFLVFLVVYFYQKRKDFWPIIPGVILLGLSILMLSDKIGIGFQNGSAILLLFIGLSFLIVYFLHNENWWAIIPGGINASVAIVIFVNGVIGSGLMFIGMGCTFLALYPILRKTEPNSWWTFIPSSIFIILGVAMISFSEGVVGKYILPIILISGGLFIIIKSVNQSKA